ncbi:CPBP family glutamic-type intramembrane protease [Flavobacterium tructae]|uniref:CPBP family glutamic-type intramembrane protease n=1 Tax=Flavobacterium tructae TaxID=1114873 RepID=UPI00255207D2|nr:CPBP family glutamic-type intramembrane protease [Flavobacterium tructae]MDL2142916.1 CPBP family glutamic-type intramembrane protease [Flavobacterium tructae]
MISKLKKNIQDLQQWQLVLVVILLNLFNSYTFSILAEFFGSDLGKGFNENYTINEKLVLFVIVGPLLETCLFQYGVIEICKSLKIALKYCCLVSALVFASTHLYNVFYFFFAFVAGMLLACLYVTGRNVRDSLLMILIAHTIYNGTVFIMKIYFP